MELLQEPSLPAAHEIGRALAALSGNTDRYLSELSSVSIGSIEDALVGYLWALVDSGQEGAFDSFIDELDATAATVLKLTVRGPVTERARARATNLVPELSVHEGAIVLFRWLRSSDQDEVATLVEDWLTRLKTQEDYNAVVDLVALYLHGRDLVGDGLGASIEKLVAQRRKYPRVGQQEWDWGQLARRQLASNPAALVELLAELADGDALSVYEGSEEMKLLREAVRASDPASWAGVMDRIVGGGWRLGFAARGWLAAAVDTGIARTWVGEDAARARALASASPVGGAELSDVVRFLLTDFGDDDEVASALVGEFISGIWSGPESDRLKRQIEEVDGWIHHPGETEEVARWARRLKDHLNGRLREVEQREAEEYG